MKKEKGFTLIELLAVIVILAIIAVIATPIILGVIGDAKKSAAKDSAYGALDAIRAYYSTSQISDDPQSLPLTVIFTATEQVNKLNISGTKPSKGVVTLTDGGKFEITDFEVNDFTCSWNEPTQEFTNCN